MNAKNCRSPCLCVLYVLLSGFAPSQALYGIDCSAVDIELTSQSEVDGFQAEYGSGGVCDTVVGNLTIRGEDDNLPSGDLMSLSALADLVHIGGKLEVRMNADLTGLGGLEKIQSIGGGLTFVGNPGLGNVDGLSGLQTVGGELNFFRNDSLENLDGLAALDTVGGLLIWRNGNLQSIDGLGNISGDLSGITIRDCASLTDIDALAGITGVTGNLLIEGNGLLSNVNGLGSVASVGGHLRISGNASLGDIDGLSGIGSVGGQLIEIDRNASLADIDGLAGLSDIPNAFSITENPRLSHVDGLASLTQLGSLDLSNNAALESLEGLSNVQSVTGDLLLGNNDSIGNLDGLSDLSFVGGYLSLVGNDSLANLDGLQSVRQAEFVRVYENPDLTDCQGIKSLIDFVDDYEPGPGPGLGGIPDVAVTAMVHDNGPGCLSVHQVLTGVPHLEINSGLNDAWFDPETAGQGFLLTVFPDLGKVFIAWFTFDTERPPDDATAILGEPGHRWLTAQGEYDGGSALLELHNTTGGVFDAAQPEPVTQPYGQILFEINHCNSAAIHYEIPLSELTGTIWVQRIALDNVPLCNALSEEAEARNVHEQSGER